MQQEQLENSTLLEFRDPNALLFQKEQSMKRLAVANVLHEMGHQTVVVPDICEVAGSETLFVQHD